jgi:hypothetical protein
MQWRLTHRKGRVLRADVRLEDDWLVMTSVPKASRRARTGSKGRGPAKGTAAAMWGHLLTNARLPSGVKIALWPKSRAPRLVAEAPFESHLLPRADDVARMANDFVALLGRWRSGEIVSVPSEDRDADNGDGLGDLCEAAGWKPTVRPSGRVSVGLDGDGSRIALLERWKTGEVCAFVELASCESPTGTRRAALGVMLLQVSGRVRMARAAAEENGTGAVLRLEVLLDPQADATGLAHALCALSVGAGRYCGREVGALLADERIAREYLTARGWPG